MVKEQEGIKLIRNMWKDGPAQKHPGAFDHVLRFDDILDKTIFIQP